ncbi:Sulfate permease 2 [Orbilia oligospora]|uniref:Sulfate permease 2 n=1 Tax=Orbilia oligospora TaxID=2813651 RepID=A0A6G1MEM4_ORBOL|nr:Sulfate permease 2 [Orbilia oligospora]KAF3208343.1 Sulfate permease 2 [Orbilia oligospora]KAF3210124.1 Sulfate permease 2 [Orbilia oligospora]KAF3225319.1 Sulfate permease 2 [Orbilia oligospora]KAF3254478.1 Sulfate permease 2 [Orbilia oligospora]
MASWQRGAAKLLGIKLDSDINEGAVTRGESIQSTDTYVEEEPTIGEWVRDHIPHKSEVVEFVTSLFPFLQWIGNYNLLWLTGDLIAGITVGFVVVPQGMAYSILAQLPAEYGLYSSFVGVMLYWFFATSKDITIGPVAVMSTLVGNIVLKAEETHPEFTRPQVASALALICGCIVFAIGILRLGFVVDYIPLPAIAAFMTGSALNIAMGQIPGLFGIPSSIVNNRAETYKVFINFWKHIGSAKLDAAMGLSALAMLYIIRIVANRMAKRFPNYKRTWFFISTLRTAFVILLYTMISWLVNRHRRSKPAFRILQKVPKGFQHMGVPTINGGIISSFVGELPAAVIVLLIEHIAISKSFGRVNGYQINPSQELIAIGITNIFGPFFGAYPATGSFSRTAIKAKAGVRTPIAGVITGIIVLLAIYLLTAVFYYIPNASLAGVIIHAVGDLITPPNVVYRFWRVSPVEVVIFFAGVFVAVFSSIENGIYTTISASAALLLFRLAKARGHFLGRVRVQIVPPENISTETVGLGGGYGATGKSKTDPEIKGIKGGEATSELPEAHHHDVFLPIDHKDGSNPAINIDSPFPGVFVFRFSEGLIYPNAAHYSDQLLDYVQLKCRRTSLDSFARLGDRPWNDRGPRHLTMEDDNRPTLKAIVLDFSAVNNVDITAVQTLIDTRNTLDKYAAPNHVDWHFAAVNNRWTKRALTSAGFGYRSEEVESNSESGKGPWKPLYSVAEVSARVAGIDGSSDDGASGSSIKKTDLEAAPTHTIQISKRRVLVHSIARPLFHVDVNAALLAAQENL